MVKLYRFSDQGSEYWETWEENPGVQRVHWGKLGTKGDVKVVKSSFLQSVERKIQMEIAEMVSQGFRPVPLEEHAILIIEYGMGSNSDLSKRHQLEDRMNETLGWTGLGACDGGSIGGGTMEVCNFVVDFDLAERVVKADLVGTDFADFTRIYREDN